MSSGSAAPHDEWHSSGLAYTRGQLIACLRAAAIAAVLLVILALLVLF
ncbi:hypothetical protein [uncultured Mycolicibacterium sp.]|nr:hypothetical protein [uncultured Mycolicibacterium sp.]